MDKLKNEKIDKNVLNEKLNYCLNCASKPCTKKGCPLNNDIPEIISLLKKDDLKGAYKLLSKTTVLPGICSRVCSLKNGCEGHCVRGVHGHPVQIAQIEKYIFDEIIKEKIELSEVIEKVEEYDNKQVAIVGGGPAGLTCAAFLAKDGVQVTIYEKHKKLGGMLQYGIPEYRLPERIVEETIKRILNLGINVELEKELNKNLTLEYLKNNYDAVYLAIGANRPKKINVKGENLDQFFYANELLEYKEKIDYNNKIVAVIGGGNVAIDCAQIAKKSGAKQVNVIYRRDEKSMPANEEEVQIAKKEGINFYFQNNIFQILGKEKVEEIELIKTKLEIENLSQRPIPYNIKGSNYKMRCDIVISAIGTELEEGIQEIGIELNKNGKIKVDENCKASIEKIFAGGNSIGEKDMVVNAVKSGKNGAENIKKYLSGKI